MIESTNQCSSASTYLQNYAVQYYSLLSLFESYLWSGNCHCFTECSQNVKLFTFCKYSLENFLYEQNFPFYRQLHRAESQTQRDERLNRLMESISKLEEEVKQKKARKIRKVKEAKNKKKDVRKVADEMDGNDNEMMNEDVGETEA